jgi:uncharacterized protein YjiS (DUF1127 family)
MIPPDHDLKPWRTSMLHSDAIADRSGFPTFARRGASGRVGARVRRLLVAAVRTWIARHAERHLRELPDHLLKDIGVARSDIRRAVRQGRR